MNHCEIPRWQQIKQTLHNLSYVAFMSAAAADPKAVLLDARTPEEFTRNTLSHSINVNYLSEQLADELEALPIDKTYYVFCQTGRRSLRVCVLLRNIGYEVINLDEGLASKDQ